MVVKRDKRDVRQESEHSRAAKPKHPVRHTRAEQRRPLHVGVNVNGTITTSKRGQRAGEERELGRSRRGG